MHCDNLDAPENCGDCNDCGRLNAPVKKPKQYFVALFLEELAYGGSEEGGWWYDCGTREKDRRVYMFRDRSKASAFSRKWNERLRKWINKSRRPKSSVLSNGVYVAHVCDSELEDYYPKQRPHYG